MFRRSTSIPYCWRSWTWVVAVAATTTTWCISKPNQKTISLSLQRSAALERKDAIDIDFNKWTLAIPRPYRITKAFVRRGFFGDENTPKTWGFTVMESFKCRFKVWTSGTFAPIPNCWIEHLRSYLSIFQWWSVSFLNKQKHAFCGYYSIKMIRIWHSLITRWSLRE